MIISVLKIIICSSFFYF